MHSTFWIAMIMTGTGLHGSDPGAGISPQYPTQKDGVLGQRQYLPTSTSKLIGLKAVER